MNKELLVRLGAALIARGFCEKVSSNPAKDFPIVLGHVESVLREEVR